MELGGRAVTSLLHRIALSKVSWMCLFSLKSLPLDASHLSSLSFCSLPLAPCPKFPITCTSPLCLCKGIWLLDLQKQDDIGVRTQELSQTPGTLSVEEFYVSDHFPVLLFVPSPIPTHLGTLHISSFEVPLSGPRLRWWRLLFVPHQCLE